MIKSYLYRGFTFSEAFNGKLFHIYYLETRITVSPLSLEECKTFVDSNYERLIPVMEQSVKDMKYNELLKGRWWECGGLLCIFIFLSWLFSKIF